METPPRDIFNRSGKVIAYILIIFFTLLFIGYCHFVFNTTSCPFPSTFYVCIGMLNLILAMYTFTFLLAMGIAWHREKYLLAWLIMTAVAVVSVILYLSIYPEVLVVVFGSIMAVILLTTAYPLYKLYKRYAMESKIIKLQSLAQNMDDNLPLNRTGTNVPPAYRMAFADEAVRGEDQKIGVNLPTYNEVMGLESGSTYSTGKQDQNWI